MGALQAAERIAWTPYSRKAVAIAEERSAQDESDRIDCHHLLEALPRPVAEWPQQRWPTPASTWPLSERTTQHCSRS
jgi:hypothetical protein